MKKSAGSIVNRSIAAGLVICMTAALFCGCSVSSRKRLINYAKNTYGDCTFISEDHGGSGDNEYRTVYLKDKDTGIEYSVTSGMSNLYIDDTNFGPSASTHSDFEELYYEWLLEEAEDELDSLSIENGVSYEIFKETIVLRSKDCLDMDDAFDLAEEVDGILEEYDVKDMRPMEYSFYSEIVVYAGFYNLKTGNKQVSEAYEVFDYVHTYYDPNAQFVDSLGAYLDQFLSYEEINELFPDGKGMTSGTAYYFKGSDGDTFVAISLKDFGAKGGIRLFRDTASGMEEIVV